ncbi:hypothetical protein DAI22_04g067500 [Oryza sativa Japonica Group]|nr:hypothetical protein DAI22_04g067500 [Oryza sativa Japonica Group]
MLNDHRTSNLRGSAASPIATVFPIRSRCITLVLKHRAPEALRCNTRCSVQAIKHTLQCPRRCPSIGSARRFLSCAHCPGLSISLVGLLSLRIVLAATAELKASTKF